MKVSRAVSVVTAAAAVGLGLSGTATAAVSSTTGSTCTTEPVWALSTTVFGTPVQNREYSVTLPNGVFEAEWSSSWNLAVKYSKTGGSPVSVTFKVFDIHTSVNGSGVETETCGWGPGEVTVPNVVAGGAATNMFSGSNQPPKPYNDIIDSGGTEQEVIAVMYVPGDGNFAVGFPG